MGRKNRQNEEGGTMTIDIKPSAGKMRSIFQKPVEDLHIQIISEDSYHTRLVNGVLKSHGLKVTKSPSSKGRAERDKGQYGLPDLMVIDIEPEDLECEYFREALADSSEFPTVLLVPKSLAADPTVCQFRKSGCLVAEKLEERPPPSTYLSQERQLTALGPAVTPFDVFTAAWGQMSQRRLNVGRKH